MSSELNDMSYSYIAIYSYRHFMVFSDTEGILIYYSRHNYAAGAYSQTLSWSMEGEACLYHFQRNINIAISYKLGETVLCMEETINMHAPPQLYGTMHACTMHTRMHALCTHACRHSVLAIYAISNGHTTSTLDSHALIEWNMAWLHVATLPHSFSAQVISI